MMEDGHQGEAKKIKKRKNPKNKKIEKVTVNKVVRFISYFNIIFRALRFGTVKQSLRRDRNYAKICPRDQQIST